MTWKFIYTYRERCKTGPAHNRCWNCSPFISKHSWMRFSKFWNTFPKVSTLRLESLGIERLWVFRLCGVYSCTLCPSVGLKERSRHALDRLPLVSNFLTNFWLQHFDGLSPNSVRNAVWHASNEPVCQYLRARNPRSSTVYIDNSLGPLARNSPCIYSYLWFLLRVSASFRNINVSEENTRMKDICNHKNLKLEKDPIPYSRRGNYKNKGCYV